MGNPPLIVGLLINGVAYAAIFVVVALLVRYFAGAAVWRVFVVATLFVAAGLYVVFALRAGEGTTWIVIEAVGVAVFGGMGLVGLFGAAWSGLPDSSDKLTSENKTRAKFAEHPFRAIGGIRLCLASKR